MHYYLDAFKRILQSIDGVEVGIVSNYSDNLEKPVLLNQYKGNKINKVFAAFRNIFRLDMFIRKHPNDKFIYLTYGNILDPIFLKVVTKTPHHCIDVHEAVAQNEVSNTSLRKKLMKIYSGRVKNIISHSLTTDQYMSQYGFKGNKFDVPHFKYVFPREYDLNAIPEDMRNAVVPDKTNILFFGNLTREKGVDILLNAINMLSDEDASKLNFIIAGKDLDGIYKSVKINPNCNVKFFIRHITDDELRFLYDKTDFLALPYRTTSQSGILEMAFYFRKPIIASDIPYFRTMLTQFPSFGYLDGNGPQDFSVAIHNILKSNKSDFFKESDYDRYENRKEVEEFKHQINKWIFQDV